MTLPTKTFAAALVAALVPLAAGHAVPASQSLTLGNGEAGTVQEVQYLNDSGYYAYGAAPGYYAYGAAPGYYAYGAAPGYVAGPRYRYRNWNFGNGSAATGPGSSFVCPADRDSASSYPSWMCR